MGVPHTENGMQYTEDERGWTFHLPLGKEGYYLFLYNESVSSIKQVRVPFGCALITRHDVIIGGTGGKLGNLCLQGSFCYMRVEKQEMKDFKVHPDNWRGFVAENTFLKKAVVKDHPVYEILADKLLQKEVYGKPDLLRKNYLFPKGFLDNLPK